MADEAPVVAANTEAPEAKAESSPVEKVERDPNKTYTQSDLDRIAEKVRKNAEYRTKRELKAYYEGRESAAKPLEKPEAKPEPKDDTPKREDFKDYEDFVEAKARHAARQEYRSERERETKEREASEAKQKEAEKVKSFQTKVREKYTDIDAKIESIGHIVLPDGVGDALAESEFGPDILAYMADNPKECERIATLSPSAALREIGKLEARLEGSSSAEPEKPKSKPSNAPEPISPVGGRASVNDDAPKGTDTGDQYRAKRLREIAARKGQRMGTN